MAGVSGQACSITRRMSWPLAIGATLRTRPTAEMIPVNIGQALWYSVSTSGPSAVTPVRTKRGMLSNVATPNACAAGQPSPPITAGAWNQAMRSTSPSRNSPAARVAPPSTSTRGEPGVAQRQQRRVQVDAALPAGHVEQPDAGLGVGLPPLRHGAAAMHDPGRGAGGGGDQLGCQRGAQVAVHHHAHAGKAAEARDAAGQQRVVGSDGADAGHHRIVPATQRVGGVAGDWAGDPLAVAAARRDLAVQRGGQLQRDAGAALPQPGQEAVLQRVRLRVSMPVTTSIPAARRRAMPAPLTRRSGSVPATTTRAMPAAISASVQGGVWPVWLHGSSVT